MLVTFLIIIAVISGIALIYIYVLTPMMNSHRRADSLMEQNLVADAIMEYKKLIDRNPGDFVAHWKLANIYFGKREIDEGVLHLEEVLRIGSYNYEVEKPVVERKLAESYILRDDIQKAFQNYFDILKAYPGDEEALYHTAFIFLGQEYFDLAQRQFERLLKTKEGDFTILFGAGIAAYQNQKTGDAIDYFKEALSMDPRSDIANLAMAFAQQRKRDYKAGINYTRNVVEGSEDENALIIARRLNGIMCVQAKRPAEGVRMLEMLLEQVRKNEQTDELAVVLYDLGFAALHAEMTELAYEYWNQLYQLDRKFKNIQNLVTQLRKEMDSNVKPGGEGSVLDYSDAWLREVFPENFLWNVCGLKSEKQVDLTGILAVARAESTREEGPQRKRMDGAASADNIEAFQDLDIEKFRILANRAVSKLGYRVDDILPTYREGDGVDFLAINNATKEKTLVWVRRWKGLRISEIPLRNLAQAVNDAKVKQGIFITTAELSEAGEDALKRLPKVRVVTPDELGAILIDLL